MITVIYQTKDTMKRLLITAIESLLVMCLLVACSRVEKSSQPASGDLAGEGKRIASVDVVKASAPPAQIAAGGSAEAIVHLNIQSGYHVNANPPTYAYLKATELEVPATDGLSVGFITYPDADTKKFPFAEKPLAVYEGEISLKVFLKAEKTAQPGQRSLDAKLRIQACDDQVCYPPGTLDLTIPVTVQ